MLDIYEFNIKLFYILIVSVILFICSIVVVVVYRIFKRDEEKIVLVFDLGGGIFDVFLLIID